MEPRSLQAPRTMGGISHQPVHVQRRCWLLWTPLALIGLAILAWQITTWEPSWVLIALGIALTIPRVADTP